MNIVVTMFDALFMFVIGMVAATSEERKSVGVSLFMIVILIMNILCIWG